MFFTEIKNGIFFNFYFKCKIKKSSVYAFVYAKMTGKLKIFIKI